MPARKTRHAHHDLHGALAAHVEANRRAYQWGMKSIELRQAGKIAQAKAAEAKAKHWLKKTLAIEAATAHGKPEGGRPARED
jgi:hypothetical protein